MLYAQNIWHSLVRQRRLRDMLMVQTKGWQLSGRWVTSKHTANVTARCNQHLFQNPILSHESAEEASMDELRERH